MTLGKASLLVAGFIGAVTLGVAIGPSLTHRDASVTAPAAKISQPAAAPASAPRAAAPRAKGELVIGRRFDLRRLAEQWAEEERKLLAC